MPTIDHLTKLEIVRRYRDGEKIYAIRNRFAERGVDLSWHTINYHITKYNRGEMDELPVAEDEMHRFKTITDQDLLAIKESLTTDHLQSSKDIQKLLQSRGTVVSISTTRKAISSAGFTNVVPRYFQLIRDANKLKRINFCNHLINTNDPMDDLIFTDETSLQLHQNKKTCYRPTGALPTMRPKPKHPLKVHVWAGISRRGPTPIVIFEGIMKSQFFTTELLQNTLLPYIQRTYPHTHRFQQDNDPKRTSKMAKEFMTNNNINWWNIWPAESCDLNPIEMVWSQLKQHVAKSKPTTKAQLIAAINEFWTTMMTPELCNKYIDHIFKVAPECVLLEGKATGDIPNKLFTEPSRGKSFQYFNDKLQTPKVQAKANLLIA